MYAPNIRLTLPETGDYRGGALLLGPGAICCEWPNAIGVLQADQALALYLMEKSLGEKR